MAVAIVHYHLRRGGVTNVIEAQSRALTMAGIDHVVLSGTAAMECSALPFVHVPDLDYRHDDNGESAQALLATLRRAASEALGKPAELWHIHNPTLGKNVSHPALVEELANSRERLVLQFHDFAEDGRPANYRIITDHRELYPLAPQIRYAFINSRDRDLLIEAGVPRAQTALLPNAVSAPDIPDPGRPDPHAPPTVLYPVRGIRRKNLGEFCLLAGLAPKGTNFAMTLAPENRAWQKIYDGWVETAQRLQLPVQLGVVGHAPPAPGLDPTYENWRAHSSHLLTTSVAEGFGLAFLEPIGLGKPLLGRDLPEITSDFKIDGLQLGDLYEHLLVPAEWVDRDRLQSELRSNLQNVYNAYGVPLDDAIVASTLDTLSRGDHLDFGNLPEEMQYELLTRALNAPDEVMITREGSTQSVSDWLRNALENSTAASPPSALAAYSLPRYSEKLTLLYRDTASSDSAPPSWLDKSAVLTQFLKPERFHFLRT